jgi:hypothetical protein
MSPAIVPLVEGHSEVQGVPVLLRRMLAGLNLPHVDVARPFRVKRLRVVREGELERAVRLALPNREGAAALLLILDADDDCPATLGPRLLQRIEALNTGVPAAVVLANRELEAWFLGAKASLRGVRGIRPDAVALPSPETIRDAKGELSQNMAGKRYLEVDDQPALAAEMDLAEAERTCPSFARFVREVRRLAAAIPAE